MSFVTRYQQLEDLAIFARTQGEQAEGLARVIAAQNPGQSRALTARAAKFQETAEWLIWLARNVDKVEKIGVEQWGGKPSRSTPARG